MEFIDRQKIWSNVWRYFWSFGEVVLILVIFAVMLARNPYSLRTLIANLEPYPDSIHYLNPAMSLVRGDGLFITREDRKLLPVVPPIYSLTMVPIYLLSSDVRSFYFINVALAFTSLFFFYLILQRVFKGHRWLIFSLLFLYVTNHLVSWFPTLAMAENALLPIILASVYLLLLPPSRKTVMILPALAVACYATKYASLPVAMCIPLLLALRIFRMKNRQNKIQVALSFVAASAGWGGLYLLYDYVVRDGNVLLGFYEIFIGVFSPKSINEAVTTDIQEGSIFSVSHARENVRDYVGWLRGREMTILWKRLALLPEFLALPAVFGLLISLFTKRRLVSAIWLSFITMTIAIMMTFYVADGRYLLFALSAIIIGVGLLCVWVSERFPVHAKKILIVLPLALITVYTLTQAMRLKFDVMLNLRYAESPWYYTSIRVFDEYLANHRSEFSTQPIVISSLPPYIIDFYSTQDFLVLPLSANQEFQSHKYEAWGDHNYLDLPGEYAKYLAAGHPVFLTKYGLGNVKFLHEAYNAMFERFELEKVAEGCHSACDVYRVVREKVPSKAPAQ
jgi:hypothetical protein